MINSKKENEPSQKYVRIFHYVVILYILILSTAVFIGGRFSII